MAYCVIGMFLGLLWKFYRNVLMFPGNIIITYKNIKIMFSGNIKTLIYEINENGCLHSGNISPRLLTKKRKITLSFFHKRSVIKCCGRRGIDPAVGSKNEYEHRTPSPPWWPITNTANSVFININYQII